MTPLQLEQLVSGYIDRELPHSRMLEMERLLRNDADAKKLYDSFLLIRKKIKAIPKKDLPDNFQKNLFRQIEMEVVPCSGSLVRQGAASQMVGQALGQVASPIVGQGVSADTIEAVQAVPSLPETLPDMPKAAPAMNWRHQTTKGSFSRFLGVLQRFRNPRVFIFPVLVLVLGFAIYFANLSLTGRPPHDRTVALNTPKNHDVKNDDATQPPYYPPPASPTSGIKIPQNDPPVNFLNDAEPITVKISCRLTADAKTGQYIPKLLADSGFEWVMLQNGARQTTTYQFKTTPEHLMPILTQLHGNRKDVLSLTMPLNFLRFFIRTDADSSQKTVGPDTPILVRINVM